MVISLVITIFFFSATATTEIYTLSLHDALPISPARRHPVPAAAPPRPQTPGRGGADRKSTRLNSSHVEISYAVFCLKKKRATATDIANFVTDAASGVVDIFPGIANAVAARWHNF